MNRISDLSSLLEKTPIVLVVEDRLTNGHIPQELTDLKQAIKTRVGI